MKKSKFQINIIIICTLLFITGPANANWINTLKDLLNLATKAYGVNLDMLTAQNDMVSAQHNQTAQIENLSKLTEKQTKSLYGIEDSNKHQEKSLVDILKGLTGVHSYGSDQYNSQQLNWGDDATSWQSILALAQRQGSGSPLGSSIKRLNQEYPIQEHLVNGNDAENQYYRLQAQTALAARASAEVSFAKMNEEATTMNNLNYKIDATPDSKSATDLNNRLASENARIAIEQTKLLAIIVQQNAVAAQEKANLAKQNAQFFTINRGGQ